ncbi:hypothetical protein SAMN05192558_102149 [Actinokineospora alba]|uniref:Uncharacterized protein n=1 Tax=Actinokineospora alba TaxID=504798 RepID=A0A1H0HJY0_9PSEU|nr:hypothetical protein [Actinokineospora alba]TDP64854.1 hypothetical protein C8E96_0329 [Actinokineospora alba]SDH47572.1 hypothetical protein SAMN05421871_101154 [Actinokineospora alba]SDO19519.1 hypothetical protein SAMN05192558_102149 [Actinokineospora alba]
MSKTDDLRALREARYAQRTAARETKPVAATPPRPPAKPARVAPGTTDVEPAKVAETAKVTETAEVTEVAEAALCGHRAISGRSCTRERGHAAKSHRYS